MSTATSATADKGATSDARRKLLEGLPVIERRVEVAGVSTAVLEGGTGTPLILLHGPGEFAPRWFRLLPHLVDHFHVIAPDLPDHGGSRVLAGSLDEAHVLRWLSELIDRTCSEPPLLLGHLLGGSIALRFSIDRGDRIRGLILVDTFGLRPFRPSLRFALSLVGFIARPSEGSYDRFMTQCLADSSRVEEDLGSRWDDLRTYSLELARSPRVRKAMRVFMRRIGAPVIPESDLRSITVPATMIWGRMDRAIPVEIAESASAKYGWPLQVIEGCADDPPMERPQALAEAVLRGWGDDLELREIG